MNTPTFPPLSRRDFVKGSALAAGGLLLNTLPYGAYAGATDGPIKVAVIGCGGRGTGAASQALSTSQNVELVAMADAFENQLEESYGNLMQKHGDKKVKVKKKAKFVGFDAYKEAISLADVVILATPPGFRPIHFEEAIRQGKHVFMEKPVATDVPGIHKVLAAAEEAKKKKLNVVVGLQRHYETKYRELVKRIHDGAIGDVTSGQVYWNSGGVWVRPREAQQTEMEYQMRNWYYFTWLCGDHILEQHIHNIDVANWVKQGYPVKAQGQGGRLVRTGLDHGQIYDHHFVEFEYADGTVVSSQCRHMPGCLDRVAEYFTGTKGRASSDGIITDLKGNTVWRHRDRDDPDPYQQEHDELFAAIANGEHKFVDAENGAKSTLTAIMGRHATYTGQQIVWDELLKSDESLMPTRFAFDATPPVVPDANGHYPVPMPGRVS
ncbi:Tat (twin-arginine translocation) pathway signal sequence [Catalinimonas alkaloidigena]|uniref:Tat (Twin-arginine translocation) pathway signal sequence n=1 Tax=Catalinimonas alkaloidigena TaxID=1075417 RepID=A0A1G9ITF7_9BACT|nr:Gfo/Idh/MocA family oxidoreductase [Catalinimonas alkaloidigena]SDL28355.1 Tat (twin-arginine translocation) pathway signal sequence [Catalinimonas alkaloidigena]